MSLSPKGHKPEFDDDPRSTNNLNGITQSENLSDPSPPCSSEGTRRKISATRRASPFNIIEERGEGDVTQPSGPKSPRRMEDDTHLTQDPCSIINSCEDTKKKIVLKSEEDAVVPQDEENENVEELKEESVQILQSVHNSNFSQPGGGEMIDQIVRAVKCQINVRMNGDMEVVVPGDEEMSRKLQNLLRLRLPHIKPPHLGNPIPPNIPPHCPTVKTSILNTITELESLEGQLNDCTVQKKIKDTIERVGGKTGQDGVRRNLRNLLSDDLAKQFSWGGREGKRSFKDLTLSTILIDSILDLYPASTALHLENAIKSWLKQAPHRQHSTNT